MANSVALREAQKRELIEVIKQQLAQENPSLTRIVQDAARLALISQKYDYGMPFKAHLEGQYPQPNSTVPSNFYDNFREKVVQDFHSDRWIGNRIHGNSWQLLEEQQQQFQQRINEMAAAQAGELPRSELIWDRKIEIDNIFINIRERVETLIAELENPPPHSATAVEVVTPQSDAAENLTMVHVFISHIHEESEMALAIKRFRMETVEPPHKFMPMQEPLNIFVSSEPGIILPGEDWLAQVRLALASAKIVIPLLTRQSLTRPWVNFKTGAAWLADKKIIPAWCEEQFVQGNFPKPYVDWQIVRLPDGADDLRRAVDIALGTHQPPRMSSPAAFGVLREAFKGFRQRPSNIPPSQQAKSDWDVWNPPNNWDPRSLWPPAEIWTLGTLMRKL